MYYRRYIPGSSRVIRRGSARRGNPPFEELRSGALLGECSRIAVGRRCNSGRSISPRCPHLLPPDQPRDAIARRSPLILISSYNWPIRDRHTIHPIDRRSCYEDLNETSDVDRCDPSILPFPASFSLDLPRAPRAHRARCLFPTAIHDGARRRSKRRIYNPRENDARRIGERGVTDEVNDDLADG